MSQQLLPFGSYDLFDAQLGRTAGCLHIFFLLCRVNFFEDSLIPRYSPFYFPIHNIVFKRLLYVHFFNVKSC